MTKAISLILAAVLLAACTPNRKRTKSIMPAWLYFVYSNPYPQYSSCSFCSCYEIFKLYKIANNRLY